MDEKFIKIINAVTELYAESYELAAFNEERTIDFKGVNTGRDISIRIAYEYDAGKNPVWVLTKTVGYSSAFDVELGRLSGAVYSIGKIICIINKMVEACC